MLSLKYDKASAQQKEASGFTQKAIPLSAVNYQYQFFTRQAVMD